ncbi:MAG TPA: fibronectin type III domain-containing protein, partial [Bacteroidota bacterium]
MHIELNIRLKEIVRRTRIVRFVAKTVIFCLMMYSRTAAQVLLSPTLVSPPDSATNQPTTVLLQWDTLANATNYEVQLSTDPAFNTIVVDDSNVTTVTKQVGPLQNSTTYYWRVRAEYVLAWSAWSSVSNFTTVAAIPSAPVLVNPPNGATNQPTSITFSWNSSTGASSYHFQVSADVGFSTTIIDQPALAATSFAASGLAGNTTYFWRVSASNSAGTSGWSTV